MSHIHVDIRKNDTVKVVSGRDKGKTGRVLRVFPDKGKALVEHVMMTKKAVKAQPGKTKGGIAEQESAINLSNVMLMCDNHGGPTRVAHEQKGDKRVRVCRKCGATLDK